MGGQLLVIKLCRECPDLNCHTHLPLDQILLLLGEWLAKVYVWIGWVEMVPTLEI